MWNDVVDLRDFYRTSLGQMARRMVRHQVRDIWPDVTGQRVLGVGYATPYLLPFQDEAERTLAAMPAQQGVLPWPRDGANSVFLTDDSDLPLPDLSVDRVILVHALECSEQLRPMLREVWRVMSGSGRLLIVVPNRRSMWAHLDRTPLGHGHPYSLNQLSRLLRDTLFTPTQHRTALFAPPARSRMLIASAPAWEKIGARWFPTFGGTVLVEAVKEVYSATGVRARGPKRRLAPARTAPPGRMSN